MISNQSILTFNALLPPNKLTPIPLISPPSKPPETMSQITDETLREAIKQRLEATHVEVTDMSG